MNALANKNNSTGAENGESRSAGVDFCRTESRPRLGAESEGLRAVEETTTKTARGEREEESYVIDAAAKVLKVLQCLEGRSLQPVSARRIAQRTGFKENACRRYLITLNHTGWAKRILSGNEILYVLGPKAENLARSLSAALLSQK